MNQERSQQFMQKVVGDVGTAIAAALVLSGDKAGLFKAMAGAGPGRILGADYGTRAGAGGGVRELHRAADSQSGAGLL